MSIKVNNLFSPPPFFCVCMCYQLVLGLHKNLRCADIYVVMQLIHIRKGEKEKRVYIPPLIESFIRRRVLVVAAAAATTRAHIVIGRRHTHIHNIIECTIHAEQRVFVFLCVVANIYCTPYKKQQQQGI